MPNMRMLSLNPQVLANVEIRCIQCHEYVHNMQELGPVELLVHPLIGILQVNFVNTR